jgi:diguanylate cyclase (GGDEF)-like protein/PAS domain S-box-containing protein
LDLKRLWQQLREPDIQGSAVRFAIDPDFIIILAVIVAVALALVLSPYRLAHRAPYVVGTYFTCAFLAGTWYSVIFARPQDLLAYSFLVVPVMLAGLALPTRTVAIIASSIIAGAIAVVLVRDGGGTELPHVAALLALTLLAGLILLALRHRDRVERERQNRLAESEQNLRAVADNANDGILVAFETSHVFANKQAAEMLGYTVEELLQTAVKDIVHPDQFAAVSDRQQRRLAGEILPNRYETVLVTKRGESLPVELTASRTTWMGRPASLVFLRDIRARKAAEAKMHKLSRAIEQTAESVLITDRSGVIEYVNPAFEAVTGYGAADALGRTPRLKKSGKQSGGFYQELWRTILAGDVFIDVFVNRRKDGTLYYEEQTITPLKDQNGNITHFVATGRDISERMAFQERLQYIAHHDVLTNLPNRALFVDRLKQALARARWHNRIVAVMFLDLDRFKHVNDSLGHEAGDQLLTESARRLEANAREGDTAARFGGDEFVLMFDDLASAADADELATKTLNVFAQPFMVDDHELYLTASIGISLFPDDAEDSRTLLQNADTAMYRAKEMGKNNIQFYSREMSERVVRRLSMETGLRRALEHEEFALHYQPIIDVESGRPVGAEVLLRWEHPERGLIAPADFIPLLEDTGLIVPVGEWVLRAACAQAQAWPGDCAKCRIGVNISGRQLNAPNFLATVERVLAETGLPPRRLVLEITESFLMHNIDAALSTLNALAQQGLRLAIDDFGVGYSSLTYIKRLPVHTLKIDQSFVRDLTSDPDDASIVNATIAMARSLNLGVVAEGVETVDQLNILRDLGCRKMQGYYFSRPVPERELVSLLSRIGPQE